MQEVQPTRFLFVKASKLDDSDKTFTPILQLILSIWNKKHRCNRLREVASS